MFSSNGGSLRGLIYLTGVALSILQCAGGLLLESFPNNYLDSHEETVTVNLIGKASQETRHRRDVGEHFAKSLTFVLHVAGTPTTLVLEHNKNVDATKPVYLMRGGRIEPELIPPLRTTVFYQDVDSEASIGVSCRTENIDICEYQLEGILTNGEHSFLISPANRLELRNIDSTVQRSEHIIRKLDISREHFPDYTVQDDVPGSENEGENGRQKRATAKPVYKIELLLVTDYSIYRHWYMKATGGSMAEKDIQAKSAMRQYYAYVINEADLMFKAQNHSTYELNVLYAGLFIADVIAVSNWTEDFRTANSETPLMPFIDVQMAYNALQTWVSERNDLPDYDHVMALTAYDMRFNGNPSAGMSYFSAMCTSRSVSLFKNSKALHYVNNVLERSITTGSIVAKMAELGEENCMLNESASYDPTYLEPYLTQPLPGQYYNIDAQCSYTLAIQSYFCREAYNETGYPSVCENMYCSVSNDSDKCWALSPLRATTCGDKKWCINGECVEDQNAPSATDSCPHGDLPGLIGTTGKTCSEIAEEYMCYTKVFERTCCESCGSIHQNITGCEYGDRIRNCSTIDRTQCPSEECCKTCADMLSDINECLNENANNCDANAECSNTVGSFNCTCNQGWTGNGVTCKDTNECLDENVNNCDVNAVCFNYEGSFTCACKAGWSGNGMTCNDINECLDANSNNCDVNAACANNEGSFTCTCKAGWAGNGVTCDDTNECLGVNSNNCDADAACANNEGSFTCKCNSGWTGNGVICRDINECLDVNFNNCDANAACSNNEGSFACACDAGWTGNGLTCEDINECLDVISNNCDANANCSNNQGSFTCTCNAGWTGNGVTCKDSNECLDVKANNCDLYAACFNNAGSFACACILGWTGNGETCTDINECLEVNTNDCDANAECVNTAGSYTCICKAGWTGSGKTCKDWLGLVAAGSAALLIMIISPILAYVVLKTCWRSSSSRSQQWMDGDQKAGIPTKHVEADSPVLRWHSRSGWLSDISRTNEPSRKYDRVPIRHQHRKQKDENTYYVFENPQFRASEANEAVLY